MHDKDQLMLASVILGDGEIAECCAVLSLWMVAIERGVLCFSMNFWSTNIHLNRKLGVSVLQICALYRPFDHV